MHKWSFRIQPLTNAKSFQMFLAVAHLRDKARLTAVEGGRRGDGPLPFRTGSHLTLTCRQPAPIVPHTAQVTCPSLAWEEGKCIHARHETAGSEHIEVANENCPSAAQQLCKCSEAWTCSLAAHSGVFPLLSWTVCSRLGKSSGEQCWVLLGQSHSLIHPTWLIKDPSKSCSSLECCDSPDKDNHRKNAQIF